MGEHCQLTGQREVLVPTVRLCQEQDDFGPGKSSQGAMIYTGVGAATPLVLFPRPESVASSRVGISIQNLEEQDLEPGRVKVSEQCSTRYMLRAGPA